MWPSDHVGSSDKIESAGAETLQKWFTTHVRKERFCEGHLAPVIENRHIVTLLRRLKVIREAMGQDRCVLMNSHATAPLATTNCRITYPSHKSTRGAPIQRSKVLRRTARTMNTRNSTSINSIVGRWT